MIFTTSNTTLLMAAISPKLPTTFQRLSEETSPIQSSIAICSNKVSLKWLSTGWADSQTPPISLLLSYSICYPNLFSSRPTLRPSQLHKMPRTGHCSSKHLARLSELYLTLNHLIPHPIHFQKIYWIIILIIWVRMMINLTANLKKILFL